MLGCELPSLGIYDSQALKKKRGLNHILRVHPRKSLLELSKALLYDGVIVPVKLLSLVTATKFNQTADQLSVSQVIAVVEIEKDLIATLHQFEVDVILQGNGLLVDTHGHLPASHINELRTSKEILPETLGVTDVHSLTIDSHLGIGREEAELGLEEGSCLTKQEHASCSLFEQ